MGGSRRRALRRVCLVAAAACAALAVVAPSSPAQEADDTVPRPDVFSGSASSTVASVKVDREALLPVSDLFRFAALDGVSTYESSNQTARAALLFPGNGLILGPSLACGTFGGQFPPEFKPILDTCLKYKYPLIADADAFNPDAASTGTVALGQPSDLLSGTALGARAHAGEDAATTEAAMESVRLNGLAGIEPLSLLTLGDLELDTTLLAIDSATSRTNQRIDHGVLRIDAEATLSGVRLLGGLVRIGSIRSESHVTDDGKGVRSADAGVEVTGVTVAGLPAQLGADGLVLGSPTGVLGPIVQQIQTVVNGLLRDLGVEVTVLGVTETLDDEDHNAVASADGLLVEFATELDGLPTVPAPTGDVDLSGLYTGSIQLGATGAKGQAATFDDEVFVPVPPTDTGVVAGDLDPGSFDPGPVELTPTPVPEVVVPEPTLEPEPGQPILRSLPDLFGGRLGFLYLAFMFSVLGLAVVPRFAVPARFPGPSS